MTWKPTEWAKTRDPLPGLPWEPMTDAAYAEACERRPGLADRGYFVRFDEGEVPIAPEPVPAPDSDVGDLAEPKRAAPGRGRNTRSKRR
jgi:hypothetical protein